MSSSGHIQNWQHGVRDDGAVERERMKGQRGRGEGEKKRSGLNSTQWEDIGHRKRKAIVQQSAPVETKGDVKGG